jgi:hypothetical protein
MMKNFLFPIGPQNVIFVPSHVAVPLSKAIRLGLVVMVSQYYV